MESVQKRNKGITLVALVITIIILLILAGITISQLTGSVLFENAKLAEQKSKNAEEKQDEILGDYENILEGYINNNRETVTIDKEEYENLKSRLTALETTEDITSAMTLNEECVTKRSTVQLTKNGNTIVLTAYLNVVGDISGTIFGVWYN